MCVDAYDNQYFSSDDPSAAVPHQILFSIGIIIRWKCLRVKLNVELVMLSMLDYCGSDCLL